MFVQNIPEKKPKEINGETKKTLNLDPIRKRKKEKEEKKKTR